MGCEYTACHDEPRLSRGREGECDLYYATEMAEQRGSTRGWGGEDVGGDRVMSGVTSQIQGAQSPPIIDPNGHHTLQATKGMSVEAGWGSVCVIYSLFSIAGNLKHFWGLPNQRIRQEDRLLPKSPLRGHTLHCGRAAPLCLPPAPDKGKGMALRRPVPSGCCLGQQHPLWVPVQVLADPLPTQFPAKMA